MNLYRPIACNPLIRLGSRDCIAPCRENVETIKGLSSPFFPLDSVKEFVMVALAEAVKTNQVHNRDPIGGSNESLYV